MKVLIENSKDKLLFSVYKKELPRENLNNTNVVSAETIIFDDIYILDNLELVSSFLKTVSLKKKLNIVGIKQITIAPIVLKVIANIDSITSVYFLEEQPLYHDIGMLLFENRNINYLNCYSMPKFLFDRLNVLRNIQIDFRSETLCESAFINNNNLLTYSQIYYKKSIVIDDIISNDDLDNINAFFDINIKLKTIELKSYSIGIIHIIVQLLLKYNKSKVRIVIIQQEKETIILNQCIELLVDEYSKVLKRQKITTKIIYSDAYKKEMMIKQINLSLIKTISVLMLLTAIALILIVKNEDRKAENKTNEIREILEKEITGEDPFDELDEKPEEYDKQKSEEKTNSYNRKYEEAFSTLLSINDDTVGWLKVNNTGINHPIVQQKDNNYYLNRDFDKAHNINGWPFLDYRIKVKELNQNNIIYGHDTYSDLMFGSLKNTLSPWWYKDSNNHIITFNTIYKKLKWRVFSVYTIKVTNDYLISTFSSKENFSYFIEREKKRSIYNFKVDVSSEDKILTLSTCYGDSKHRLVVHAKLIK